MLTLITTAPDGTVTRGRPVFHGEQLALSVAEFLRRVAPWMTAREARSTGLQAARSAPGFTHVHAPTGYHFLIEAEEID